MFLLEFDAADPKATRAARTAFLGYLQREILGDRDLAPAAALFDDLVLIATSGERWARASVSWQRDGTGTLRVSDPEVAGRGVEATLPLRRRLVAA